MFGKSKSWTILITLCMLTLLVAGVVYAATYINQHDGPNWDDANNVYTFGVCSDTAYGETVCTQYTTDGTDLQYTGNNPSTWNGTKAQCVYQNDTTCTYYWLCTLPETANATIKYRFYVVNQSANGDCSYNGDVYYGQGTNPSSFNTGPNAVTLSSFSASGAMGKGRWIGSFAGVAAVLAAAGIFLKRRYES